MCLIIADKLVTSPPYLRARVSRAAADWTISGHSFQRKASSEEIYLFEHCNLTRQGARNYRWYIVSEIRFTIVSCNKIRLKVFNTGNGLTTSCQRSGSKTSKRERIISPSPLRSSWVDSP